MRLCILALFISVSGLFADNWPQWRGPHGTGVSGESTLPTRWSTNENVRWRTALPARGNSTPVIWGNRVFITQPVETARTESAAESELKKGTRRTVMCFDRSNGKILWQSGVDPKVDEPTHADNPYCSGSAVTDGERVIAWFGSPGIYAYDFNGRELWHRDLGEQRHIWGNGSSPVIFGNVCYLNFGPGPRSLVVALDKRNGKTLWEHDELGGDSGAPKPGGGKPEWIGSWSTPIIVNGELIVALPSRVAAFDPGNGDERWSCRGLNPLAYTSPLDSEGIVVAMGGFGGSSLAVKTGGRGDVTETHRLWQVPKNKQRIGSGVIHGEHIYIVDDPGVAECIEVKTGKVVWEQRLNGQSAATDNWSSMVAAGEKLYAINKAGDGFVLRASPKFEVLGANSLHERTLSSIAPSNGELFIRTYQALWCIGDHSPNDTSVRSVFRREKAGQRFFVRSKTSMISRVASIRRTTLPSTATVMVPMGGFGKRTRISRGSGSHSWSTGSGRTWPVQTFFCQFCGRSARAMRLAMPGGSLCAVRPRGEVTASARQYSRITCRS